MRPKIQRKPGYRKLQKILKRWHKAVYKGIYKYWLLHLDQYSDPSYIAMIDPNTNKPTIYHLTHPIAINTGHEISTPDENMREIEINLNNFELPEDKEKQMGKIYNMYMQWINELTEEDINET